MKLCNYFYRSNPCKLTPSVCGTHGRCKAEKDSEKVLKQGNTAFSIEILQTLRKYKRRSLWKERSSNSPAEHNFFSLDRKPQERKSYAVQDNLTISSFIGLSYCNYSSLLAILGNSLDSTISGLRLSLQWGFLFQLDDVSLRRRRRVLHRERRMPTLLWKLSWQLSVSLQVFVCF